MVRIPADVIGCRTSWRHKDHLVFPPDKVHTSDNYVDNLALPGAAFSSNIEKGLFALRRIIRAVGPGQRFR